MTTIESKSKTMLKNLTSKKVKLHTHLGKDGEGLYTASTKGCFDVIDEATPLVLDCLNHISLPNESERAFVIADYGTADAGTSLGLMNLIVNTVRQKVGKNLEISIQYEDQKDNEWKSVFNHVLGFKQVTNAYGEILKTPRTNDESKIFVNACGVSFHKQAYPSNSVDLGFSFTAMHWLSQSPSSFKGTEIMHASGCNDLNICRGEKEQAAIDWNSIIKSRCKELRVGGRMVIVNFCISKEGYYLGNTEIGVNMWDSFVICWNKLAEEGLIDEEERLGVSFPSYYRSYQESVEGAEAIDGIKVIDCIEKIVRCPYREEWTSGKSNRTPLEHAEWYVPTTRTWSESTFKQALKNDKDKEKIMEKFWKHYVDLVAAEPEKHGMDYVHTYLVIEKTH